jgi:hypothetical protein
MTPFPMSEAPPMKLKKPKVKKPKKPDALAGLLANCSSITIREPVGQQIILDDFPFPPQSNNMFYNTRWGGRRKSDEYQQFESDVFWWAKERLSILATAKSMCQRGVHDQWHFMTIDMLLCVPNKGPSPTSMWTSPAKKSARAQLKVWDGSNRIKAAHDALSRLLHVPDHYFTTGPTEKVILTDGGERCVTFRITFNRIRTRDAALASWTKKAAE